MMTLNRARTHPLDILVHLCRRLGVGNVRSEIDGRLPLLFGFLRQLRLRPQRPVETVAELGSQLIARLRAHLPLSFFAEIEFGTDDGDRRTLLGGILNILW